LKDELVMQEIALKTLSPASAEEASEIFREVWENNTPVNIRGGGSKQYLGNPGSVPQLALSTLKLDKMIAYEPSDLTVTVQTGMDWNKLQQTLAKNGQWVSLDPPALPGATVGGVIATNVSGPFRLLQGTARDIVIGCQFVLVDGSIGRSGGRVVKNVTGYDLHKLLIGSLGTLALLTEVSFKILPLPESRRWLVAGFDNPSVALETARKIVRSNLSPAALELLPRSALENKLDGLPAAKYLLFAAATGLEVAVARQLEGMDVLCKNQGAVKIIEIKARETGEALWKMLRDLPLSSKNRNLQLRTGSLLTDLPFAWEQLENLGLDCTLQGRAGTGLIYGYANLPSEKIDETVKNLTTARDLLESKGGSLVIEKAPDSLKKQMPVWGAPGGSNSLSAMQVLKNNLDGRNLLNPGKLF
jgi:glycolate oxidase FAD binding subunit